MPATGWRKYCLAVDRFVLSPSGPLSGTVEVNGAKNSVLKLMAACLLAPGLHRLDTVPRDVTPVAPYELVEKMRASIVVLGPLLARYGTARVSMPGGDDFGYRPIDFHLSAFEDLGARFVTEHGYVEGYCDRLKGAHIVLQFPSHTATDNILMGAVLAKGTTVIENAAREPEISDLAAMLTEMGASISGAGTSRIEVEGVDELSPANHRAIPDRVEAATFVTAVGLAGGEVLLRGARPEHMDMLLEKLGQMGMVLTATEDGLLAMGAKIKTDGHHAIVRGVPSLSGARVRAPDIRAGAALVLAGLAAEGITDVDGAEHIDRGYEDLDGRLRALGANIERLPSP